MKPVLLVLVFFMIGYGVSWAALILNEDIGSNTTLLMSNNPHQIRGNIKVLNGTTLTIEPGVNIFFEPNSSLTVEGSISATGTATMPISFNSLEGNNHYTRLILSGAEGSTFSRCLMNRSDDNTALLRIENSGPVNILNCGITNSISGHGVYINNSNVSINSSSVGGVGTHGLYITGTSTVNIFDFAVSGCQTGIYIPQGSYPDLSWDNIQVDTCSSYPVWAGLGHYAALGGFSAFYSSVDMLGMWDSNVYSSYTLPYRSMPYYLPNNLNLYSGSVLTLEPGVGLRFAQWGKLYLSGGASLQADGTSAMPISFAAGGDYHWNGIAFDNNSSGVMDYCTLMDCGYPQYGYPEPSISINNASSLTISNTTVPGGSTYGIYCGGSNEGTLNLVNVSIEDCPWTGLYILNSSLSLDYANLEISGCGRPIAMPANLLNFLDEQPNLNGNTDNRIFLHNSGYLNRHTTIRNWGFPYVFENIDLNVNWVDLAIQPGCELQFGYSLGVYVNGTINAVGTASQPVLFTRLPGSTQNWRGFYLNSGTSYAHFDHCILEHCASSNQYGHIQDAFTLYRANSVLIENTQILDAWCRAVYLESSDSDQDDLVINNLVIDGCGMDAVYQNASGYNLSINGLTVNSCNAYPLSLSANWIHQVSGITLTNNANNVIRFVNGGYLASQTLTNHGYPYQISGANLWIYYTSVVFQPGTVFYFEQERGLEITGSLTAAGTALQPIVFDRPPSATYFWERIYLNNNSSASFEHCQFLNGGRRNQYGYDNALLDNSGATLLSLQNCLISNVDAQAISCHDIGSGDAVQISNVQINGCRTDGFWCNDDDLTLSVNNFSLSGCLRNPISILASQAGFFANLSLNGNASNDIRLFGYNGLNGTRHFPNHGYVYRCEEGLSANNGSSVSFDPGCVFWIADNRYLDFYGAVSAVGTTDQPIVFTRYPVSTNNWIGVRVFSSSWDADFAHCRFLYGGAQETYGARRAFTNYGAGDLALSNCLIQHSFGDGFVDLDTQNTDLLSVSDLTILDVVAAGFVCNTSYHEMSVTGLSIDNCGTWPIYSSVDLLDRFAGVTIVGAGTPYIGLGSTTQTRNATWPNFGLPYRSGGPVIVNDWVTLNIISGTELVFDNYVLYQNNPGMIVYGALNTLGTQESPVTFRGMDINAPSTWVGVRIYNPDAGCNLNYTNILNAGLDENHTPPEEFCALYIYNGTVNLTGCRIATGNHNLLKLEGNTTTTLTNCQLDGAVNGIIHNAGILNLVGNTISALSGTGIYHYGGTLSFGSGPTQWNRIYGNNLNLRNNTAAVINAPYVYWGSIDPNVIDATIWDDEEGGTAVNFEPWYDLNCTQLYYHTLDTPENVTLIEQTPAQFIISWSSVSGATSYKVLSASDPNATQWNVLQQGISGTQIAIDVNPALGKCFYKVVAVR